MGMDVYGKNPQTEEGKYFRSNVWWWHPLATYCEVVAPKTTKDWGAWHHNDGEGLNDSESLVLAALLEVELESGRCQKYEQQYKAKMEAMPLEVCEFCKGTGARTDEVGKKNGLDKPGGCNGCAGKGTVAPFATWFRFDCSLVREFVDFLKNCGGFEIC